MNKKIALRKPQHFATLLILILAVIGSMGDGCAEEPIDSSWCDESTDTFMVEVIFVEKVDSLSVSKILSLEVYAAQAESLSVIDGVLIECANGANYPHNGEVAEEGK